MYGKHIRSASVALADSLCQTLELLACVHKAGIQYSGTTANRLEGPLKLRQWGWFCQLEDDHHTSS